MLIHDYNKMPPLYKLIYYKMRFKSGKDIYIHVSKVLEAIKKNKMDESINIYQRYNEDEYKKIKYYIESGESESDYNQLLLLSKFKYNNREIHPDYDIFYKNIYKTKKSTTVELRKILNKMVIDMNLLNAHTKQEVEYAKSIFNEINITEIMNEVYILEKQENKRILDYQNSPMVTNKNYGLEINNLLGKIAPNIISNINKESSFFGNLTFIKDDIGFFIKSNIGKDGEILNEILKESRKNQQLFVDLNVENDENFFISFSKSQLRELSILRVLMGNQYLNEPLEGFKLLGIPIQVVIENCQLGNNI